MASLNVKIWIFPSLFRGVVILALTFVLPAQTWGYRHHQAKVRYQEYSQQAFDLARQQNRPIFLVLSASWCFWCKKYDEQTLNTDVVSSYLNENFVNIFVDLDRRPDLRHLFVKRAQPTSVIFTPDGKEFLSFSGTLKADDFMTGMRKVLADIQSRNGTPYGENAATVSRPWALATRISSNCAWSSSGRMRLAAATTSAASSVFPFANSTRPSSYWAG